MGPMKYKSSVSSVSCGLQYHHSLIKWSPKMNLQVVQTYCSSAPKRPEAKSATEMAMDLLNRLTEAGTLMGKNSFQKMSATCKSWWERYEEFVGINEVRDAQGKVTEEEKRYRAAYLNAEESEREKFTLFSAAVRESHEKERTRAEKTKNWSIIGSVLGAIIGVLGSTYVNRVRLQELKVLVLEAQKGPINLQEAIKEQASSHYLQQKDLSDVIADLKNVLQTRTSQEIKEGTLTREDRNNSIKIDSLLIPLNEQLNYTKQVSSCLGSLQQQFNTLQENLAQMISEMQGIKLAVHSRPMERVMPRSSVEGKSQASVVRDVILELCDTERRLETQIKRNSIYSTAVTCAMFAVTLPVLYIILKGN
ncbi:mitochondrial potassium channel isoform X2 [Grus americana]|uniref:mitochondrial potassium channel isoform X2 n=1 Tax=Grus americana TaxID=9117 RepID=UPI0024082B08|nr:mitochondrial potassium channel isoform X2 [Grus americana]